MKKALRIFSLLLVLCFVFVAFAACDSKDDESSNNNSADTDRELFAGLPDKDYGGATVTFLVEGDYRSDYASAEIMAQETSPEILNDKVNARNELVENRFNVVINEERTSDTSTMVATVRNAVLSNLPDYDIVMPYIPDAATLALEEQFYLLNEFEYLDLTNPCWD
ncbi:MAG: hypothetical protein IKT34_01640, partial [Clostridia bacterium]|nr:hypothetical protein [Clostridia bacterium]